MSTCCRYQILWVSGSGSGFGSFGIQGLLRVQVVYEFRLFVDSGSGSLCLRAQVICGFGLSVSVSGLFPLVVQYLSGVCVPSFVSLVGAPMF